MTMVQKKCQHGAFWHRLVPALLLAMALCLVIVSPAIALDLNPMDYFDLIYDPVTFDKTEINGVEVFYAHISGRAICSQDLPVSASEAIIISSVVAKHSSSGAAVTLNPEYIITIKPFPSKEGATFEIVHDIALQFPANASSGNYDVIGTLIDAKVKWGPIPVPVTSFLPQEQQMGTVKYTATEPASTPSEPSPAQTPATTETEPFMPWWVETIILIAVAATVFNIVWFLRHRRR